MKGKPFKDKIFLVISHFQNFQFSLRISKFSACILQRLFKKINQFRKDLSFSIFFVIEFFKLFVKPSSFHKIFTKKVVIHHNFLFSSHTVLGSGHLIQAAMIIKVSKNKSHPAPLMLKSDIILLKVENLPASVLKE